MPGTYSFPSTAGASSARLPTRLTARGAVAPSGLLRSPAPYMADSSSVAAREVNHFPQAPGVKLMISLNGGRSLRLLAYAPCGARRVVARSGPAVRHPPWQPPHRLPAREVSHIPQAPGAKLFISPTPGASSARLPTRHSARHAVAPFGPNGPEGRRGNAGGAGGTLPLRPFGGERAGVRWGCVLVPQRWSRAHRRGCSSHRCSRSGSRANPVPPTCGCGRCPARERSHAGRRRSR